MDAQIPPHGTDARYKGNRTGTRTLIDAEPIRQHILELQDLGLTPTRIARLASMSHTNICDFLHGSPGQGRGRKRQTTPEIAEKILAVQPIATTGTIRRIQALVAVGWPIRQIAARADVSTRWIVSIHPGVVVNLVTSKKIAAAYEQLRKLNPEKHGVWPGHAKRARERAAANRWPTPRYWDQHPDAIDDPHFEPEYKKLRGEIIAEEAHWLITAGGLDRDQVAARLGIARFTIDRALREHPQDEMEVAA